MVYFISLSLSFSPFLCFWYKWCCICLCVLVNFIYNVFKLFHASSNGRLSLFWDLVLFRNTYYTLFLFIWQIPVVFWLECFLFSFYFFSSSIFFFFFPFLPFPCSLRSSLHPFSPLCFSLFLPHFCCSTWDAAQHKVGSLVQSNACLVSCLLRN